MFRCSTARAHGPALVWNFDSPMPPQLPQRAGVVQRFRAKVKTLLQLLALRVAGGGGDDQMLNITYQDFELQRSHQRGARVAVVICTLKIHAELSCLKTQFFRIVFNRTSFPVGQRRAGKRGISDD